MYGTLKISGRGHLLRSSSTHPECAPSTRLPRGGCTGAPVWTCRFPGNTFLIIAFPGSAFRSFRGRAFPPVAYSSRAQSRLGYSPNGAFDRAYHTTTGKCEGKTNNGLDKKSGPFPAARPTASSAFPCASIVAQRPGGSTTVAKGWSHSCQENSHHQVFYNLINPKED